MDVQQLYGKRFVGPELLQRKNRIWQVLCKHFFQKYIPAESVVVDMAAGYCEFINSIKAKTKIAFDLNPDTKLFADEDVRVINDSLFNMGTCLQDKADVIFASNILEHLDTKEQVITTIKVAASCLKSTLYGGGVN
jgi:predicted RNA methylase